MFLAAQLPAFGLQAALRRQPGAWSRPQALSQQQGQQARLCELNPAALRAGVEPGLTVSQGIARCPHLGVVAPSPVDAQLVDEALFAAVYAHAARVEKSAPGMVLANLRGTAGDPVDRGRAILAALKASGLHGGVGIAPEARHARYAALLTDAATPLRAVTQIAEILPHLPLSLVTDDPDLRAIFRPWGLRMAADFVALPRAEVANRLGAAGARLWDELTGRRPYLLDPVEPPPEFVAALELEEALESLEPLRFLLRRFLETLAARLEDAAQVAATLLLRLGLDDGGDDTKCFRLPVPTRDVATLERVLHTHLEQVSLTAAVVSVSLEVGPTDPAERQETLFQARVKNPWRFADTLDRLAGLVGSDHLGAPAIAPTWRPGAFVLQAVARELDPPTDAPAAEIPPGPHGPALRRFRPPWPVRVRVEEGAPAAWEHDERAREPEQVVALRGPWRGSGTWWDAQAWEQEEWDVITARGGAWRLARQGKRWQLEGRYD